MTTEAGQFATFVVSDLSFAVDVLRVQEVLQPQPMTRVPLACGVIEGLINLRGQIVTAIDMRRRLGLPPRGSGRPSMNMVIRYEDAAVSLLVDEIGDVLQLNPEALDEPPVNLDSAVRNIIRGIYKLPDRLLLVLDIERAVDLAQAMAA
ncbi:MAG TPA: chemotaxis protein CheW [Bryobacteraceae bacterium]|nr:chemotaxis protein CheW [Bryobacteraceae bacterium]